MAKHLYTNLWGGGVIPIQTTTPPKIQNLKNIRFVPHSRNIKAKQIKLVFLVWTKDISLWENSSFLGHYYKKFIWLQIIIIEICQEK